MMEQQREQASPNLSITFDKGWLPDFPPFAMPPGGLYQCKNYIPYHEGYWAAKNKQDYSTNSVSGTPYKGIEVMDTDGSYYQFIATTTKLYRLELDKSFTDISKSGYTYGGTLDNWSMVPYGNWLIATNFADPVQVLKGLTSSNFIDLGGNPPKAKYALLIYGHLILGYLNENGVVTPNKVRWSGFENPESWTASLTTGAGSQVLYDTGGEITAMAPLGNGFLVFHPTSVTLGYYSGAPLTFSFIANRLRNIGAIPESVVSIGTKVFFFDRKNIYAYDGETLETLGNGIQYTLINSIHPEFYHRISTAVDTNRGLIFWAYPSISQDTGVCDRILVYNYDAKRYALIEIEVDCLFGMHTGAQLLDDLNYTSFDDIPYQLDSAHWKAKNLAISCMNPSNKKLALFTGTSMTGTIETGEFSRADKGILFVNNVRLQCENPGINTTVQIGKRMLETEFRTYTNAQTLNPNNKLANVIAKGRYLTLKITTVAQSGLVGAELFLKNKGKY